MFLVWQLSRYARCYSDSSKQCLDSDRKSTIFQYFAHLDTQRSHAIGNFWSSINSCSSWKLNLTLNLSEQKQIEFEVTITDTRSNCTISLEKFKFPEDFKTQFKLSARKESIGFRYTVDGKKFLFQVFFNSEYDCHLCFDSFCRFGLLSGHWSDPFQFIQHDLERGTYHSTGYQIENNLNIYTPEFSYQNISEFEKKTEFIPISASNCQLKLNLIANGSNEPTKDTNTKFDDPDVTQLEIYTDSTSISSSQMTKKRQLIILGDIIDIQSLQSNVSEFE